VFATSPTLVTPALGTPASGDLSNCTAVAKLATLNTYTKNGDQSVSSLDTSKFRRGTWSDPGVLSGGIYTLLGELCMWYWSDNVA